MARSSAVDPTKVFPPAGAAAMSAIAPPPAFAMASVFPIRRTTNPGRAGGVGPGGIPPPPLPLEHAAIATSPVTMRTIPSRRRMSPPEERRIGSECRRDVQFGDAAARDEDFVLPEERALGSAQPNLVISGLRVGRHAPGT